MNIAHWTVAALLLVVSAMNSLAQGDSPCNQGRDPWREPRNPYAICMPEVGRMDNPSAVLLYLFPVGDVDRSGTADFVAYTSGGELLLYKGTKGRLPLASEGERIGPTEKNSLTEFLAAGDWDADSNIDIAVRIHIQGDTTGGNQGRGISRLAVFWGNQAGVYSLQDTTRLECGAQMWISIRYGLSSDFDGDGVEDLLVSELSGFTNNVVIRLPKVMIFKGHKAGRWGEDGTSRMADWHFWNSQPRSYTAVMLVDQDQDGVKDIVFSRNESPALESGLSILYGTTGRLPDTTEVQTISFVPSNGRFAYFSDVTGDQIHDLLIGSGRDDFVKVYVGFKGQRLLEQYGSGNDSARPEQPQWWGKPWATIWLPRRINPGWFGDNDNLFDLGDANRDGISDIFAFSWPYVMEYNGGDHLDSLADALINITPGTEITTLKRVGDIDGSGRKLIALATGNGVRFYAPTKSISSVGVPRQLPEGTGKAGVEDGPVADAEVPVFNAIPNPSHDQVQFSWNGSRLHGPVTITLFDVMGKEVARCSAPAGEGSVRCDVRSLAGGTYVARLHCGDTAATTTIVIR